MKMVRSVSRGEGGGCGKDDLEHGLSQHLEFSPEFDPVSTDLYLLYPTPILSRQTARIFLSVTVNYNLKLYDWNQITPMDEFE